MVSYRKEGGQPGPPLFWLIFGIALRFGEGQVKLFMFFNQDRQTASRADHNQGSEHTAEVCDNLYPIDPHSGNHDVPHGHCDKAPDTFEPDRCFRVVRADPPGRNTRHGDGIGIAGSNGGQEHQKDKQRNDDLSSWQGGEHLIRDIFGAQVVGGAQVCQSGFLYPQGCAADQDHPDSADAGAHAHIHPQNGFDLPPIGDAAHECAGGGGPGHPAEPVEGGPPLGPLAVLRGAGDQDAFQKGAGKAAQSFSGQIQQERRVGDQQQEDQEDREAVDIDVGNVLHRFLDAGYSGRYGDRAENDGYNQPHPDIGRDTGDLGDTARDVHKGLRHRAGHTGADGEQGDSVNDLHPAGGISPLTQQRGQLAGDGIGLFCIVVHKAKYDRGNRIDAVGDDGPV